MFLLSVVLDLVTFLLSVVLDLVTFLLSVVLDLVTFLLSVVFYFLLRNQIENKTITTCFEFSLP